MSTRAESAASPPPVHPLDDGAAIKQAADLLSQQIWCWGQDILRPQGNWLLETGFDRVAPPAELETTSSVYTLELPQGRRVVLRGFGVFFGGDGRGGVFLKRYGFQPLYTPLASLAQPPWMSDDLPPLNTPTGGQRERAGSLTVEMIDWLAAYEADIATRLGLDYRRATLGRWENNRRPLVPAEAMAASWRALSRVVAEDYQAVLA